jgi:predicted enzyme related to lactoylglutathione lyase
MSFGTPMSSASIVLSLVVMRAQDTIGLSRFYRSLGLPFEKEKHGSGPEHYSCSTGEVLIEIYPLVSGDAGTTGLHLGFSVDSLERTLAIAVAEGATMVSGPKLTQWGRRAVIKDPEGHTVEFLETDKARPKGGVLLD